VALAAIRKRRKWRLAANNEKLTWRKWKRKGENNIEYENGGVSAKAYESIKRKATAKISAK
jgi:hypothetical protein